MWGFKSPPSHQISLQKDSSLYGGKLIYKYLKRRAVSLVLATFCTFCLALVSSLTFSLVGPAIEVLTKPLSDDSIPYAQLFGNRFAAIISWFTHSDVVSRAFLWTWLPLFLVGAALLRALLGVIQWFLWEQSSEKVAQELRDDLVSLYLRLHPEKKRDKSRDIDQELGAAIGNDIRMVREYLVHFYGGFPREMVQVIFYLVWLFLLDPILALVFLLGIGPSVGLLSRLGKKLRKRSQKVLGNTSQMYEWLQQRLSGVETIKQFRTEDIEQARMEGHSTALLNNFLKAARVKARTSPLMEIVAAGAMALVLVYALRAIAAGTLSSSTLLSFFAILAILSQSASKLGRYYNSNKEGETALNRLQKLFEDMESSSSVELPLKERDESLPVSLRLKGLGYRYPGTQEPALANFSADFAAGRIYAIAGPSGSGKSTLLKILLGVYEAQEGETRFHLTDRTQLGYLPQSIQLLSDSIAANILYPGLPFDAARMEDALAQVGLLDYVKALPRGWDTAIGEGGETNLSGGQMQRIKIARLVYARFPLIIIDEGTSALDPEIEALIFATLRKMAKEGACIIMVAHRLSALQIADEVWVLKKGRIFFQGPSQELLLHPEWRSFFDNESQI